MMEHPAPYRLTLNDIYLTFHDTIELPANDWTSLPQPVFCLHGIRPLLAGRYQGADQIFRFWKKVAALSGGGMRLEVLDVLANEERGVVFVVGRAQRDGRSLEERGLHVYRFVNGLAIEGHFFYEDQNAYDAFWS